MANRRSILLQKLLFTALLALAQSAPTDKQDAVNSYNNEYGVYLGQFSTDVNSQILGQLFVVNETTLQVIDFSYTGKPNDAYFWLSKTETPTSKDSLKLPTFNSGFTPLDTVENVKRVVLNLPAGNKVSEFKSLSVYSPSEKTVYGTVLIPDDVVVPKTHFLPKELFGSRYNVRSGPILILDTRTIKIFGFTFDGDKAPDGYFFVGRGLNVAHDVGTKALRTPRNLYFQTVPIRGKDTSDSITPMNERYRGGQDIIIDLPENFDVYHIDLLSVLCYKFRVDFAHVPVNNLPANLPPFVPPQTRFNLKAKPECDNAWKAAQPLLGTEARSNFTLQLGPSGGVCGYQAINGMRPSEYVWYVNGYMAELYLKRGLHYTFIIEGGQNNSLYISDEPFGGYSKLEANEKKQITVYAPKADFEDYFSDRLCLWEGVDPETANKFGTFEEFRQQLHLNCVNSGAGDHIVLKFSPDNSTPSTVYANSLNNYGMGFKIHVVDELPTDIPDIHEQPFTFEAWTHHVNTACATILTKLAFIACSFLLVLNTVLDF